MNRVNVYYKKELAGILERTVENHFIFTYLLEYQGPSLSLTLPKSAKIFQSQNLFAFFDGLIPEGWLLKLATDELRLNPLIDRFELLCALCTDTIGAVHIGEKPSLDNKYKVKLPENIKLPTFDRCLICYQDHRGIYHDECMRRVFGSAIYPLVDINQEILEKLAKSQLNKKLAVSGVQKKISLELQKGSNKESRLTITDLWGGFIFKPKGKAPHLPENEHLCQLLAEKAGLECELSALIPMQNGELGFIAKRFDRGSKHEEYHQEDFCQILDKPPHYKYQGSLEQIGKVIKSNTDFPGDNLYRMLELTIFNYLIGNVDFHLKNVSLTYESKKGLRSMLSPAYDLLSTDLYINDVEESALAINGKKNKLNREDFVVLAKSYGISEKVLGSILKKFESIRPIWETTIRQSFLTSGDQEKLISLIEKKWTQIAFPIV